MKTKTQPLSKQWPWLNDLLKDRLKDTDAKLTSAEEARFKEFVPILRDENTDVQIVEVGTLAYLSKADAFIKAIVAARTATAAKAPVGATRS